ncbi:MAG: DNA repair protein RecO [Candidatus Doudnabacteria bacterium]|jgi:DNA repair protein RecO
MSRETKYTGIILKKQPLGDTDELITLFTKEQGKVRVLAKSVKSAKSKLQQKLQALFFVEIRVTIGALPKIIGVETIKTYSALRENLEGLKYAFYALEFVLKFSADEQKNEKLFGIFESFLEFLNSNPDSEILDLGLLKFKLSALETVGFAVHYPPDAHSDQRLSFSPASGGFSLMRGGGAVEEQVFRLFLRLKSSRAEEIAKEKFNRQSLVRLQNLLSDFIEYQLERKLKSEIYLKGI